MMFFEIFEDLKFLKIFDPQLQNFKKIFFSEMLKIIIFQLLLIFSFFLGKLAQVAHICPILPPRNFCGPRGYPLKIEKKAKNQHCLSRLK